VEGFYNDTYLMDQNACSSPHLVVWVSAEGTIPEVKKRFWESLYKTVTTKYNLEPVSAVDKFTALCSNIIDLPQVQGITKYENLLYVLELNQLPSNVEDLRGQCGYFYEYSTEDLSEISHIVNEKYQTLTYFGFDRTSLSEFVLDNKLLGVDRIVPIGSALDISIIWDGYDLVRTLSRICDIQ
jgi:hypothetical protein